MPKVTILTTKDDKQWLEILNAFNLKDPHYLPKYLGIFENDTNRESFMHFSGQGCLFVYSDSSNSIIYPFFKRSSARYDPSCPVIPVSRAFFFSIS